MVLTRLRISICEIGVDSIIRIPEIKKSLDTELPDHPQNSWIFVFLYPGLKFQFDTETDFVLPFFLHMRWYSNDGHCCTILKLWDQPCELTCSTDQSIIRHGWIWKWRSIVYWYKKEDVIKTSFFFSQLEIIRCFRKQPKISTP